MISRPVVPRELALRDVREAVAFYLEEGGERVALAFTDALERAFIQIGHHPAAGSSRYAHELEIPDLRTWPVGRFPYLAFYVARDPQVEVWRVLHAQRDLPAWMAR